MLHLKDLYQALAQNENFVDGLLIFTLMSENDTGIMHMGRFWVIDTLFPEWPFLRVGISVWDNQEDKLYGPFFLQNTKTVPLKNMEICHGNKRGTGQVISNFVLKNYYFFKAPDTPTELHLLYDAESDGHIIVSGFDGGQLLSKVL